MKRFSIFAQVGIVLNIVWITLLYADAPLKKPTDLVVWSENKEFFAEIKYAEKKTTVYKAVNKEEKIKLWEMDGWFRWTALSNDGKYFAIPYFGANLLNLDYQQDTIMLTIAKEGKIVKTVKLNELIEDFKNLRRTSSHYYWGNYFGFSNGKYIIKTVEDNRFAVDLKTKELIKIEN